MKIFLGISLVVTLPFLLLTILGQIKNETGLIMLFPMLAGLPWVLVYTILPFDIPGFTSPASLSSEGMILTISELFLFMIPVYINIYFITAIFFKGIKKYNNKIK